MSIVENQPGWAIINRLNQQHNQCSTGERMVDKTTTADVKNSSADRDESPNLMLVDTLTRNRGTDFQDGWVDAVRVNLSAVERRCATLNSRRTVKKQWQAATGIQSVPGKAGASCGKPAR